MRNAIQRLYRTKTVLACVILSVVGVGLITFEQQVGSLRVWAWVRVVPWSELGAILFGAGLIGIGLDAYLAREKDEADDQRLRDILRDQAPAMRDAVLEAFAANHADLARVATPEMLDQIIANSLALRLGDELFAREIYDDIRDQAVNAQERWLDATVSIRLSPLPMGRGVPAGDTPTSLFTVTVRYEYAVVPRYEQRRFVCVSDRDEYAELAREGGATSAWYLRPKPGVDAGNREAFELLQFSVNGERRPIRRTTRKGSQIYTVAVGIDQLADDEPVTVAYTYCTVTERHGHLLYFDIEQPTRGISVKLDYSDCGIATVSALDLIASSHRTRIERSPAVLLDTDIRVEFDGWVFPRSGVAFVWTLNDEVPTADNPQPNPTNPSTVSKPGTPPAV